jgi:hypothetical protein
MTDTEKELVKVLTDAAFYGTGFMKDGKHIPIEDVYIDLRDATIEAQAAEIERLESLIGVTANYWLALQDKHPVQWEGAIDAAMEAACAEIELLLNYDEAKANALHNTLNQLANAEQEIERLRELLVVAYIELSGKEEHASDCATSNAPAMMPGRCDCD